MLKEEIGTERYSHGPTDFPKKMELLFRVRGLDLLERRRRYTNSRVEKEVDVQNCPWGKATGSTTHTVAKFELYKQEWDVLEREM